MTETMSMMSLMSLLGAVVVASIAGSPHCAGMCGVFVAFATGAGDKSAGNGLVLAAAYHGGRLVTYVLLGCVCGLIGGAVEVGGSVVGLSRAAAVVAGSMMIVFGVAAVLRSMGVRIAAVGVHGPMTRWLMAGQRAAMKWPAGPRALTIGMLTTLLPCGWLWAFAVTAAATASPWMGAAVMAAFWVGTVPVLAAVGLGVRKMSGISVPGVSVITSVAIVVLGVYMIWTRSAISADALAARSSAVTPANLVEHVHGLEAQENCCGGKK
jgi:sulfite exporter TauE/SafE